MNKSGVLNLAAERPPCSVVLEGGVTSAVVYASLLARLSESYTFKQLGGASSGAVAAAAAAAAEYARQHVPGSAATAFKQLAQFPADLAETNRSGRTLLYRLFQPTPRGMPSFNVAMAALDQSGTDSRGLKGLRVLLALALEFPVASVLIAAVAAVFGWHFAVWWDAWLACAPAIDRILGCSVLWTVSMLPTLAAALLALLVWALCRTLRALRENDWGLCCGMDQPDVDCPALTRTLHGLFQQLAGLPAGPLLTFGHLWWGPGLEPTANDERLIDLQIVTTSVSQARPVRLPGDTADNPLQEYFYCPDEWARLFPREVMQHLQACARPARLRHNDGHELFPLPDTKHLPVIVAARFSLSFPILLSALPMYIAVPRRDMLRAGDAATKPHFEARKVYFSDGGITSNCPVHLFDAPLPRFPTFGVNLYELPSGQERAPFRSDDRDPELDAAATTDAATWGGPVPFLLAILRTMLDWRDSLQRRLPGFRERMVHIGLPPEVGGLHLAMKPATILRLARLGIAAADQLTRDFATAPQTAGRANAWDRHRWTRARTSLTALHAHLAAFAGRLGAGKPTYERLVRTADPPDHPFASETARRQAVVLMEGTAELMKTVDATSPNTAMDEHSPEPRPELHLSPPW